MTLRSIMIDTGFQGIARLPLNTMGTLAATGCLLFSSLLMTEQNKTSAAAWLRNFLLCSLL